MKRSPLKENVDVGSESQSVRANKSAVQWLFNPFSVADTTNWAVSTGVGKLAIGSLTKVKNVTEKVTPNKSNKEGFHSTSEFAGARAVHVERERFAANIGNEITNAFPRRVHKIVALEGIEDVKQVKAIQDILLGEEMAVAMIEGSDDPVPVLPQMLEKLRYNMREISKTNSPNKALLLSVGRQMERAIEENMKLAVEDLKQPQQEVAQGKKAGFDNNAKRNFLALGKPIPELKLGAPLTPPDVQRPVDERILGVLEKFADVFGEASVPIQGEPDTTKEGLVGSVTEETTVEGGVDMADINAMIGQSLPVEVEAEFKPHPKIVTTTELTGKQVEKAVETEQKKADEAAKVEYQRAEEGLTQCAAITGKGEQCSKNAVEGSRFCKTHNK